MKFIKFTQIKCLENEKGFKSSVMRKDLKQSHHIAYDININRLGFQAMLNYAVYVWPLNF